MDSEEMGSFVVEFFEVREQEVDWIGAFFSEWDSRMMAAAEQTGVRVSILVTRVREDG